MKFIPDQVVARLQTEVQTLDLSGTRYRALRFLGHGGMASVWLAEDSILRRPVALKILAAENSSLDLASRLMQEAVILARLEHPGIVPVHDAGTLSDGRTFYCMKYVEGQTLERCVEGLDLRQRLQLFLRIAEPLAFAHSRGIIHRDLKPANIMVGPFGEVLVMDWGLAKVVQPVTPSKDPAEAAPDFPGFAGHATLHGSVLGTPGYMAPEQERGDVHSIDQRTDVFALGAVLRDLLHQHGVGPGPRQIRAVRDKAMAPDVSARYSSVQELAADVGRYLDGLPVTAYRENILERTARLALRNRVAIVLVLAYLFMRLLFILFSRH